MASNRAASARSAALSPGVGNLSTVTPLENVSTTDIIESATTDLEDLHIVVIPSSPLWHLTVGVVVSVLGLIITIVMSPILIHQYYWSLDERKRKKVLAESNDSGPFKPETNRTSIAVCRVVQVN